MLHMLLISKLLNLSFLLCSPHADDIWKILITRTRVKIKMDPSEDNVLTSKHLDVIIHKT